MRPKLLRLVLLLLCLPLVGWASGPDFTGRWRLDTARSSALDGWNAMDLVITRQGTQVMLTHHMVWGATRFEATNTYDTDRAVTQRDYFRVEQRHMAVYPAKGGLTHSTATWIDGGATLRLEVETPVEVSQGTVTMRITSEYRLDESGQNLTLIELHSSRNRPLVYVYRRISGEVKS